MANCSHGRNRGARAVPAQTPPTPITSEPPVHRWPHPLNEPAWQPEAAWRTDPTLHYIRCALSYQNQLLADIKALLEQLVTEEEDTETP